MIDKKVPATLPARSAVLTCLDSKDDPDAWRKILESKGFRLSGDSILPPVRIIEYPGVCTEFQQWDVP